MFPTDVVIVAGARTPMARYTGSFSDVSAIELAAVASKEAIKRSAVDAAEIDHAMLPWIASRTWSRADFPVTRSGIVRVQATLVRVLAQRAVAAVPPTKVQGAAEWLGDMLLG